MRFTMTNTESVEKSRRGKERKMKVFDVNKVFTESVIQATKQGRVTTGLYNCAKLLQTGIERVVICILPQEIPKDDLQHMQHVLIEAHCREHRINIIKITSEKKLENLLLTSFPVSKMEDPDVSCVLIEKPRKDDRDDPGLRMLCKNLSQEPHSLVLDLHV